MNTKSSNYQKHLNTLYHRLNSTIYNLYHMGFSIGLQWEWQELKSEIKDRGWLPLDKAHLKVIEHSAMPGIIKMIEILEGVRKSLTLTNQLKDDELKLHKELHGNQKPGGIEDYSEEDNFDMWQQNLFVDLLSIFEACWKLEYNINPPMPVYDKFGKMYFNAEVEIPSDDRNVRMVVEAINNVLRENRKTVFAD